MDRAVTSRMARLVFEVPGNPMGKGRHRSFADKHGKVVHVAHKPTESYEAQVKWFARQAMGQMGIQGLLDGPLWLHITTFSLPNKEQEKAMAREPNIKHYCTTRPDWDNIGKIVADALNRVAYRDDAIIALGTVEKLLGPQPKCVVSIGKLLDYWP